MVTKSPRACARRSAWPYAGRMAGAHPYLTADAARVFKHDGRSRVWLVEASDGPVVVKRFEYARWRQAAAAVLGLHPAQRERRAARRLIKADLPVAPIIAFGAEWAVGGASLWLATRYVGPSVHEVLRTDGASRALLDAIATVTAALLRAGFVHRDHKVSNLLVDDAGRVWLTDVGAIRRSRAAQARRRTLTTLSKTLREVGVSEAEWAEMASTIARKVGRK
jgi:tRNA A-37 threonylcarbamoyl transferase component Bud32